MGAFQFGFNADEYEIKGKRFYSNKKLEPYFNALNDPLVIDDFNYHRNTRPVYLAGPPLGMAFFFVGLGTILNESFKRKPNGTYVQNDNSETKGFTLMALGAVTIGASIVVRVKSFSKMHAARKRYNLLISQK